MSIDSKLRVAVPADLPPLDHEALQRAGRRRRTRSRVAGATGAAALVGVIGLGALVVLPDESPDGVAEVEVTGPEGGLDSTAEDTGTNRTAEDTGTDRTADAAADPIMTPDFSVDQLPGALDEDTRQIEHTSHGWTVRFRDGADATDPDVLVLIISYLPDQDPDQVLPSTGGNEETDGSETRRRQVTTPLGEGVLVTFDSDPTLRELLIAQADGSTLMLSADGADAQGVDLAALAGRLNAE